MLSLECKWIIIYRFLCITSLMREILKDFYLCLLFHSRQKCFGLAIQIDLSVKTYDAIKLSSVTALT